MGARDVVLVRMEEVNQSLHIIRQLIDNIPKGPVNVSPEGKEVLPPKMRHPHATTSQRVEHGGMANPLMNQPPLGGGSH